jgi:hypothetical protein
MEINRAENAILDPPSSIFDGSAQRSLLLYGAALATN